MSSTLTPLASLIRPTTLDDVIGQEHLVGVGKPIRRYIEAGKIPSMIFWWPPGSGKTSLAYIISQSLPWAEFFHLSGVLSKKEDVVKILQKARKNFTAGKQTILFLDEIHRWMKSQQDVLLPFVEKGIVTLIGATTENPSFTINNALISRTRVYTFEKITEEQCVTFLENNLEKIHERYPNIDFSMWVDNSFEKSMLQEEDFRWATSWNEFALEGISPWHYSSGELDKESLSPWERDSDESWVEHIPPWERGSGGFEREDSPFREYNSANTELAKTLRKNMTRAEKDLWYFLRWREERWLRQKPIWKYIVDFYCSSCHLVIEVDGATHSIEQEKHHDQERTEYLESVWLKVIRFENQEVYTAFEWVCEKILQVVGEQKEHFSSHEIPPTPFLKGGNSLYQDDILMTKRENPSLHNIPPTPFLKGESLLSQIDTLMTHWENSSLHHNPALRGFNEKSHSEQSISFPDGVSSRMTPLSGGEVERSETEGVWKKYIPFPLIAHLGNGDLRNTLNILETACMLAWEWVLTREIILQAWEQTLLYDRDGEEHYNLISAMHKSLRDSDGDAAIYWIGRMLAGGEDPRYIVRRMINFASEDVFDPQAMILANAVYDICEKMGMPECELPIMNLAYYLADLPKNNHVYMAMKAMQKDIGEYGNLSVPLHLRNAPTALMREVWYGKGYEYAHDLPEKKSSQEHFPDVLKGRKYRKM